MIGYLDVTVDFLSAVHLPSFLPRGWTIIGSLASDQYGAVRFVVSNAPDLDQLPDPYAAMPRLTLTVSDAADVRMITVEVEA